MTADTAQVASVAFTVAGWLFICGIGLVLALWFVGRGHVDAAAADLNEHDTQPLPTIEEAA